MARFFAFQERDYIGAHAVRLPSAREQRRAEVAADQLPRWLFLEQLRPVAMFPPTAMALRPESNKQVP